MLNVLLLAGGTSAEHEVSISTAKNVMTALDTKKYNLSVGYISKEGAWSFGKDFESLGESMDTDGALASMANDGIDIVFLGLHGAFGEDGKIQQMLDGAGVSYTGSGSRASALAMDKIASQHAIQGEGVKIIPTVNIIQSMWLGDQDRLIEQCQKLQGSLIIKPNDGGSSIGIIKCSHETLKASIEEAFGYSDSLLVQPFLEGREFSCGVLERKGRPFTLPVTEIVLHGRDFFDYESKYDTQKAEEITPANIAGNLTELIQHQALRCHQVFGCKGYSRTDFMLSSGELFFLETNTLPGLTKNSILPKQAEAVQISYSDLLDLIIKAGLK